MLPLRMHKGELILEHLSEDTLQSRPARRRRQKKEPKRFAGIDIVKIVACFFVVAVHFFLNSGFYGEPITEDFGRGLIYIRWITFCCVPLFMITTGYLMKNKTFSGRYYCGIVRVLVIYLVVSFICIAYNILFLHTAYTPWTILRGLLMYSAARYGWYVEYYFTLFAVIPFLNAAWNGLKNRGERTVLLLTVILLTMVSYSFYIGREYDTQIRVLPGYFYRCYPIAYYFIGVYIREYPPRRDWMHKAAYAAVYLLALMWISTVTYRQCRSNEEANFIWRTWHYEDYGAWPIALMSTMLFLLLFDIRCQNRLLAWILTHISNATFAAYLVSYVFDSTFYTRLNAQIAEVPARFAYAPAVIICVFVCSICSGLVIQGLYDLCAKRLHRNRKMQTSKK